MALLVERFARESELLALRLQEEELQAQRDALLAQRLAMAYACRRDDGDDEDTNDDVEFVMEVSPEDDEVELIMQVNAQLAEVQGKQGEVAAKQLQDHIAEQERAARDSRAVAEVIDEHEKRNAQIARHDAAFARRLRDVDDDTWYEVGDELEEPLRLPPPRKLPKLQKADDVAAARSAAAGAAAAVGVGAAAAAPATPAAATATATATPCAGAGAADKGQQPAPAAAAAASGAKPTAAGGKSAPAPVAHGGTPIGSATGPPSSSQPARRVTRSAAKAAAAGAAGATAGAAGAGSSAGAAQPSTSAAAAHAGGRRRSGAAAGAGTGATTASTEAGAVQSEAPTGPTIECMCCFDRFPDHEVTCAGADAASSSTSSPGCGHYFCGGCMAQYVLTALKDRKFPVPCPMAGAGGGGGAGGGRGGAGGGGGCKLKLSRGAVMAALEEHPKEQQAFSLLEAQQAIPAHLLIYCPHKACSMPLQGPDDAHKPQAGPTACPACRKAFCAHCRIAGWHQGYSCAEFQALPAHLRSAEDAAMLAYSARQQWKQCPACRQMVERSEGCNHMLCRCGANFCYACGLRYRDTRPTAGNVHGTPGCGCPLFDVPEEREQARGPGGGEDSDDNGDSSGSSDDGDSDGDGDIEGEGEEQDDRGEDEEEAGDDAYGGGGGGCGPYGAAAQAGPYAGAAAAALRDVPWRGGRRVRLERCRHASSMYECPYGNRCWFWHEEDDGPL